MAKQIITTDKVALPLVPLSSAVRTGNLLSSRGPLHSTGNTRQQREISLRWRI
jgi:hypothetical protein